MTNEEEIRFKCLELAVKTTPSFQEQMGRAVEYYKYVLTPDNPQDESKSAAVKLNPAKRTDNAKILP